MASAMKCDRHEQYGGKQMPRTECQRCWRIYLMRQMRTWDTRKAENIYNRLVGIGRKAGMRYSDSDAAQRGIYR